MNVFMCPIITYVGNVYLNQKISCHSVSCRHQTLMNAPASHARTERTVLMTSTLTTARACEGTREYSVKQV